MKGQREKQRAKRAGRNTYFLRRHADLTVQGLAAGVGLSINHVRKIEAGESNMTARTAGKICDFFDIEIAVLYGSTLPKVRKIEEMPAVKRFYETNKENYQFFRSLKDKNSVAHFLKEVLLKKNYFRKAKREVADVVNESNSEEYRKNFNSKEISRELIRLVERGFLARQDKTGKGKRYLYYEPE